MRPFSYSFAYGIPNASVEIRHPEQRRMSVIQDRLPECTVQIHTFFTQAFVGIRFLLSLMLLGMTENKGNR